MANREQQVHAKRASIKYVQVYGGVWMERGGGGELLNPTFHTNIFEFSCKNLPGGCGGGVEKS